MKVSNGSGVKLLICLAILSGFILFPARSRALRPIDDESLAASSPAATAQVRWKIEEIEMLDDQDLEILSPSVHVKEEPAEPAHELRPDEFERSVCFTGCHKTGDFSASDKTKKQWLLLIEQEGHAIFEPIEWDTPRQKAEIMDYLLRNAGNSRTSLEGGIGVWE